MEKIATVPFIIDSNQPNILFSSILDRYVTRFANTNLPSSFHCFKVEWTRSKILPLSETNKFIKTICKTTARRSVNIVTGEFIGWTNDFVRSSRNAPWIEFFGWNEREVRVVQSLEVRHSSRYASDIHACFGFIASRHLPRPDALPFYRFLRFRLVIRRISGSKKAVFNIVGFLAG